MDQCTNEEIYVALLEHVKEAATEKERENKRGKPDRQKKTAPSFYRKKNDGAVRK